MQYCTAWQYRTAWLRVINHPVIDCQSRTYVHKVCELGSNSLDARIVMALHIERPSALYTERLRLEGIAWHH